MTTLPAGRKFLTTHRCEATVHRSTSGGWFSTAVSWIAFVPSPGTRGEVFTTVFWPEWDEPDAELPLGPPANPLGDNASITGNGTWGRIRSPT